MNRDSGRKNDQLRDITIETNYNPYADGSCLISYGNTKVICTASIEESVPSFLKGKNKGWLTAEYGMLPRSTHTRMRREAAAGKQSGRTQEIQRLIGRSLRAVLELDKLGERQIIVDCDVIQADGGTRTASITGGYVAMTLAITKLIKLGMIRYNPIIDQVAAISCGILHNNILVDLDYEEDSSAQVDANFIITAKGKIVEIQSTAEEHPFEVQQFHGMMDLALKCTKRLFEVQSESLT
jgi:ribonuclease PH